MLVVTDTATSHVLDSIREFNSNHEVVVKLWQLHDLIMQFEISGFARLKLEQITEIGVAEAEMPVSPLVGAGRREEERPIPPATGE